MLKRASLRSSLNKETLLEEAFGDVVCYLGQEVGGKSSMADVRKDSFFVFITVFVLLTSDSPPALSCLKLVDVRITLFFLLLFVFKGSTIFLGFSGNFKPSWAKLFTSPAGQGLGLLEQFIPLQLDEYGCHRTSAVRRRDLELLMQTSKAH